MTAVRVCLPMLKALKLYSLATAYDVPAKSYGELLSTTWLRVSSLNVTLDAVLDGLTKIAAKLVSLAPLSRCGEERLALVLNSRVSDALEAAVVGWALLDAVTVAFAVDVGWDVDVAVALALLVAVTLGVLDAEDLVVLEAAAEVVVGALTPLQSDL